MNFVILVPLPSHLFFRNFVGYFIRDASVQERQAGDSLKTIDESLAQKLETLISR